jgi:hypothetical protein
MVTTITEEGEMFIIGIVLVLLIGTYMIAYQVGLNENISRKPVLTITMCCRNVTEVHSLDRVPIDCQNNLIADDLLSLNGTIINHSFSYTTCSCRTMDGYHVIKADSTILLNYNHHYFIPNIAYVEGENILCINQTLLTNMTSSLPPGDITILVDAFVNETRTVCDGDLS